MVYPRIDESIFPSEREEGLKKIARYSMFDVMMYRSTVWQHSHRVLWLLEELLPHCVQLKLDPEKARILALVHDDPELITGDIQAGHKAQMSEQERVGLETDEEGAARRLSDRTPKEVHGYVYHELLVQAIHKNCIEAQVVSYADKLDAYCETLHEFFAGNLSFIWSVLFYERCISAYMTRFPALAPLLRNTTLSLVVNNEQQQAKAISASHYVPFGKPHTVESLETPTDFMFYNEWRKIVLAKGGDEGKRWLIEQKETLPTQ